MNMWTNYSQGMPAGTAGGFYDLAIHAVVSRLNGQADTALKPGMGVVQGDKPGSNVKIPATGATLEQFEGIVINDVNREMNMDGELLIQPKTTVGVMQYGRIWVRIADGVEPKYGDPVHLIINGTGVGCFKAAAGRCQHAGAQCPLHRRQGQLQHRAHHALQPDAQDSSGLGIWFRPVKKGENEMNNTHTAFDPSDRRTLERSGIAATIASSPDMRFDSEEDASLYFCPRARLCQGQDL